MNYAIHMILDGLGIYESMVSLLSRRYMRGENGTESLVVCLSEYVTLHSVYTLLIAVY